MNGGGATARDTYSDPEVEVDVFIKKCVKIGFLNNIILTFIKFL